MNKKILKTRLIFLTTLLAMVVLLSSAGIAFADSPSQPQMVGSQWAVYEQATLANGNLNFYPAAHADTISTGGVQFSMPDATASSPTYVNYLLDTFTTSLTESNTITATISVVPSSGTTAFLGDTFGGINSATPAFVRLFIQANLPNDGSASCVGGNSNVDNYWWADVSSYTFVTGGSGGTITLTASLNNANWSGICGNPASSNPTGFDSAIANIKYVGLSFGSGYFFASGVGVDGTTGTAAFQLISYVIS
jgi:hypothetical protein